MDRISVRLRQDQQEAAAALNENGQCENESEALRRMIDAGMREYGFRAGEYRETMLRRVADRLMWGFALVAVVWFGATALAPVSYRLPAFGAAFASLACLGMHRLLGEYEPRVSERLRGLVSGERAVTDGGERDE